MDYRRGGPRWAIHDGIAIAHKPALSPIDRRLPLVPVLPGIIVDTLVYAAAIWAIGWCIILYKRARRVHAGLCRACGYEINQLPICPECGLTAPLRP
jgi:hypothetical protein